MSAGVLAAAVLLGGPAAAQEDPCAPGPDGQVPEMCQSGPAQPGSDTGTVGMEPEDPCAGSRPVEPGDGVVEDGGGSSGSEGTGDEGIAVGEPAPGTEPGQDVPEGEPKPEPREPGAEEPAPDGELVDPVQDDGPGAVGEDGVVCAFAVPISAPGGAESGAGGGVTSATGQLPRTGPYDRLLALTAVGSGFLLLGAGITLAGRRRDEQV